MSNGCTAKSVVLRESFGSLVLTYVDITALSLDGAVFCIMFRLLLSLRGAVRRRGNPHPLRCAAPPVPGGDGKRTDCHSPTGFAMTWGGGAGPSV